MASAIVQWARLKMTNGAIGVFLRPLGVALSAACLDLLEFWLVLTKRIVKTKRMKRLNSFIGHFNRGLFGVVDKSHSLFVESL